MKKSLKITLIVVGVLVGIILLDTLQARIFKNSPIISWEEKLEGDSYVDKSILLNTYYCVKDQDIVTVSWHFKTSKFTCPIDKTELKSVDGFELIFTQESGNIKRQIIDKNNNTKYDYNVYIYNGNAEIVINNKTYSLEEALKGNKITMDEIITKAKHDFPNAVSYDDGGSIEYHYENYTIIKINNLSGNRDVYIGGKNLKLNDLNIINNKTIV